MQDTVRSFGVMAGTQCMRKGICPQCIRWQLFPNTTSRVSSAPAATYPSGCAIDAALRVTAFMSNRPLHFVTVWGPFDWPCLPLPPGLDHRPPLSGFTQWPPLTRKAYAMPVDTLVPDLEADFFQQRIVELHRTHPDEAALTETILRLRHDLHLSCN